MVFEIYLELQTTSLKWIELVISNHFSMGKILNHPIETTMYDLMFQVPYIYIYTYLYTHICWSETSFSWYHRRWKFPCRGYECRLYQSWRGWTSHGKAKGNFRTVSGIAFWNVDGGFETFLNLWRRKLAKWFNLMALFSLPTKVHGPCFAGKKSILSTIRPGVFSRLSEGIGVPLFQWWKSECS